MSRDPGLYLQDILEAAAKIETITQGIDRAAFSGNWRIRDVVLHNLEVIGEAVKRLPEPLKAEALEVPWKRIAGFRDILALRISRLTIPSSGTWPRTRWLP